MSQNRTEFGTAQVVGFPNAEEERARRLKAEVDRLARMSPAEWIYYTETAGYAEKYGIDKAALKEMVEATVAANEKRAREDKGELRRVEKQKTTAKREGAREQERRDREEAREEERREREAKKEAERKGRDKWKTFDAIIKLPSSQHEGKLKALAKRLDADVDTLSAEFAEFAQEGKSEGDDVAPWPKPIATKALLTDVLAQLLRYTVVNDDQAIAIALWIAFAWLHDSIAVYSPILVFKSAEPDCGKTTVCGVLRFLTPRAYPAAEMSGPSLFRFVDQARPTLIIDDADRLLQRKPDLAHVVNVGWTKGTLIPRCIGQNSKPYWFNPFCAKVIAGAQLLLPKTTATRTITIKLWPKLPSERVEDFNHIDDERFLELRRKLLRWSIDNVAALKTSDPALPPGFNNRLAMNWRLQLAIADLAGGDWPKQARAAAANLDDRREELSEGIRLLAALRQMFAAKEEITSEAIVRHLNADPTADWGAFRNHGPITQRQVAALLKAYDIRPIVLHPTRRSDFSPHGYRRSQFADAFARYLPPDPNIRTPKRKK
jgi:Protein of unknown function (DUF3631)